MIRLPRARHWLLAPLLAASAFAADAPPSTLAEVLEHSAPGDWRELDPAATLYLELAQGRVVIELAPAYAPRHVANLRVLAREHYFDGLAVDRVQDGYVVQWGDAEEQKPTGSAARRLAPEFLRPISPDLPFTPLPDRDVYAPEVGLSQGFPVARDSATGRTWLVHCYGMVGAGRDEDPGTGSGAELYVVIGHAPRHLDRNMTLIGRVVEGMALLTALPRGTGPMGFYASPSERAPIRSVRLAADVAPGERTRLEVLRTDTAAFAAAVEARRNRREAFFQVPAGRIDLCNVPLPVRAVSR